MSVVTKYGKQPLGGVSWQSDFQASRDDKNGWKGSESFKCTIEESYRLIPFEGSPCKFPGYEFMSCSGVDVENDEGGNMRITVKYSGVTENGGDDPVTSTANKTYSISITNGEEDLITHFRYKDLIAEEKKIITNYSTGKYLSLSGTPYKFQDGGDHVETAGFEVTSVLGKELVDYIGKGVTRYLLPATIWRASYTSKKAPSSTILNAVGKITSATGAPTLSNGRNWLFNGITTEQDGKVFKNTLEWQMSGPGGWDAKIYEL